LATNQSAAHSGATPTGIVLVNLGTPAKPRPRAVARFLREFLTDRRIIELHPVLWRICLEVCVLPVRSRKSAAKYATVWLDRGSPIVVHSQDQAAGLAAALNAVSADASDAGPHPSPAALIAPSPPRYIVRAAMRYGSPSIAAVLDGLAEEGVRRVLVVPMYPQYSQTTVASIYDSVARHLATRRDQPELRFVRSFPTHPWYIEALAQQIDAAWAARGRPDFAAGDRLILSFHGIPQSMADDGDPYHSECLATAQRLRERLGLGSEECLVTFQSKFGPSPWLTPATIDTVRQLGAAGTGRVDIMCPGFVADCLETLEEIDQLNREAFTLSGGGQFVRIPCLNANSWFIDALAQMVREHTAGWGTPPA
jgi:ferrochelatase